jgi:hypothetical protein
MFARNKFIVNKFFIADRTFPYEEYAAYWCMALRGGALTKPRKIGCSHWFQVIVAPSECLFNRLVSEVDATNRGADLQVRAERDAPFGCGPVASTDVQEAGQ